VEKKAREGARSAAAKAKARAKAAPRGPAGRDRRRGARYKVKLQVDYSSGDTFLFSSINDISELGIFILTSEPLPPGTPLRLKFSAPHARGPVEVRGRVVWVNPYRPGGENINPGMGIKFVGMTDEQRRLVKELVRTIAYLSENWI